jgi:hypothetical protein
MNFLALFITLATRQSAGRMRVWRALKALGAATLRDGVYLLPDGGEQAQALEAIAADVRGVGGTAEIYRLDGCDEAGQQRLVALFDRGAEYADLLARIRRTDCADAKALRALRRDVAALVAIDYFPGEAQRQAQEALAQLEPPPMASRPLPRAGSAVSPAPTSRAAPGPRASTSGSTAWPRPG